MLEIQANFVEPDDLCLALYIGSIYVLHSV